MTIQTTQTQKTVDVIESVTCDCCGTTATDKMELQEWILYSDRGGYNSEIGDGDDWSIDLCQECIQKLLGHRHLRTTQTYLYLADRQVQTEYDAAMIHVRRWLVPEAGRP